MEDELLFETSDGSVFTETEAVEAFGDQYQEFIDNGQLKPSQKKTKTDPEKDKVTFEFDEKSVYISQDGTEFTGLEAIETFGDGLQEIISSGQLKKKDQSVVSTGGAVNTVGTTPLLEIPDTLLDSGEVLLNQTNVNSVLIDGVPFSELDAENQNKHIEKLDAIKDLEDQFNTQEDFLKFGETKGIPRADLLNYDLLKTYTDATNPIVMGRTTINIKEDGKITGKRNTPAGMIATAVPGERNWLNKLLYSEEDLAEITAKETINPAILDKVDIDLSDYQAWERENTKEDGFVYQEVMDTFATDDEMQYQQDKRNFQKLSAYTNSLGTEIGKDINIINNQLKFESDPETRKLLLSKKNALKDAQSINISRQYNFIKLFPELEKAQNRKDLRKKEYIINQRDGDFAGGVSNIANAGIDSGVKFVGGMLSMIPSWMEQGANLVGFEAPGLRAINDFLDTSLSGETAYLGSLTGSLGEVIERSSVEDAKSVTTNFMGKPIEVGVTPEGKIIDLNTMMDMAGMFTSEEVKEIYKKAEKVPNSEMHWTGGSLTQGMTSTVVNLIGLIKGGKWATGAITKGVKALGYGGKVYGGIGMAAVSYASSVAGEVNDIKKQLMAAGIPEEEAMDRAILYGNGRASLDGLFSGLAGANTKLLTAGKSMPKILKDLILKPKNVISSKVFQKKVKDLAIENFKEVVIEELPVLFTGNFLNSLVNDSVGQDILNETTSKRDIIETVVLTLGATTGIGSRTLISKNGRADLLRVATESTNIEEEIAESVNKGHISEAEGKIVYQEIYNMQTAKNQTQGSIVMSGNIEEAGALLDQRRKLMQQREGLEGVLKEGVDKKIEDVDAQIKVLKDQDTLEALTEMESSKANKAKAVTRTEAFNHLQAERDANGNVDEITEQDIANRLNLLQGEESIKQEKDAIQKRQTEKQVLSDDGKSKEGTKDANVELPGVGVDNTRKNTTESSDGKSPTIENENKQDRPEVTKESLDSKTSKDRVTEKDIVGPDTFTHQTKSIKGVIAWITGGKVLGKGETLGDMVEGSPQDKTFNLDRSNRSTPNFQKGGFFGSKPKKGYVVISNQSSDNFQPNQNGVNKNTLEESRGIGIPKSTDAVRDIKNFDIYKVNGDGTYSKIDISNLSTSSKKEIGYRAGDLVNKAESKGKFSNYRDTGHFGTGFYFFSEKESASDYGENTGNREVSEVVDLDEYNLAEGTVNLHNKLKDINDKNTDKKEVTGSDIDNIANETGIKIKETKNPNPIPPRNNKEYNEAVARGVDVDSQYDNWKKWEDSQNNISQDIADSVNKKLNNPKNTDSASTIVMKELGFEGVDSRGNSETDNSRFGSVVYDVKKTKNSSEVMSVNKRQKQPTKYKVPGSLSVDVEIDSEGKPVAVDRKTGRKLKKTPPKAEKFILTNVVDVNDGDLANIPEGSGLTPDQVTSEIAAKSNNVREIAETIEQEKQNQKSQTKAQKTELADPLDIINKIGTVTEEDFSGFGDASNITPKIRRYWFKKKNKYGQSPKSDLDTRAKTLDGYTQENSKEMIQAVLDFIIANPTGRVNIKSGKSSALLDLEAKFEELTGLKPTQKNLNTVMSIDPNRDPIAVTKEKSNSLSQKEASEPGVFSKNKKGPSAKQIVSGKPKKLNNVDEAAALKDQIKLEVKAANDSKKDQTKRRKSLSEAIKSLKKAGKISTDKMNQLIKKVSGVNLNNSRAVAQVLSYVEKVNNDANAVKKTTDAKNQRRSIKRKLNKDTEAEVSNAVKAFLEIDIDLAIDLDAYSAEAKKIITGLTKSKQNKDGSIDIKDTVDIKSLDQYTNKTKKDQDIKLRMAEVQAFRDITGINSNELTLEQMRDILHDIDSESKADENGENIPGVKAEMVSNAVKKAFSTYRSIVDSIVKTKTDPFTGETIKLSDSQKILIRDFMNIDLDLLSTKEKLAALDAIVNFGTNQGTGGMAKIVELNVGRKNVKKAKKIGLKAKPLKLFGSKYIGDKWNDAIAQMPIMFENMFRGQSKGLLFEKLSGFGSIRKGAAKGEKIVNDIADAYHEKFIKLKGTGLKGFIKDSKGTAKGDTRTMPNGEAFNSVDNDVERGLFGFMRRTVDGTKEEQKKEFTRRKGLIEQSIDRLKEQGETEKADAYQRVYDRVLKGTDNVTDLDGKVDAINKEAVEWMTQKWADNREALESVSLNYYNRVLGKDINYTPDSMTKVNPGEVDIPPLGEPVFQGSSEAVYDKESGVLMAKKPGHKLPAGRIVNLGFDSQNINNLKTALTDIETAEGIQQLKGFIESPDFKEVVPDVNDRKLLLLKLNTYVDAKRGVDKNTPSNNKLLKVINSIAGMGVSRVLGGPTQYVKQLIPVINTAINLMNNPKALLEGLKLSMTNKAAIEWLNNSGYEISNRGLQSITNLEGTNTKLSQASNGKLDKAGKVINDANKKYLELFLVAPDKFAARASWMAYYVNDLKKQGIDSGSIDWSTHIVNESAAEYAQQQTARQQNTSDTDLQGSLFSGKSVPTQIARKVFFPFANFLLNQKSRMYTDLGVLTDGARTTKEDKSAAAKSLTGLVGEAAVFNAMGLFITQGLAGLSGYLTGDDDEDAKEKAFANRVKGRSGNVVTDILSPIPILDTVVLKGANAVIDTFSSDDPFQFFDNDRKTTLDRLGVLGIVPKMAMELIEMVELATTGKYTDAYGNEKEIDPKYQGDMGVNSMAYFMYLVGMLPAEAGSIVKYNVKSYKKMKENKGAGAVEFVPPKKKTKTKTKKTKSPGPLLNTNSKKGGLFNNKKKDALIGSGKSGGLF